MGLPRCMACMRPCAAPQRTIMHRRTSLDTAHDGDTPFRHDERPTGFRTLNLKARHDMSAMAHEQKQE